MGGGEGEINLIDIYGNSDIIVWVAFIREFFTL